MNAKTNPSQIKKSSWWLTALIAMIFVLAACAPAATPTPQAAAPTAPPATEPPAAPVQAPVEATINVTTDAKLGQILVDGAGMTLYMFTKDEPDKVNCAGKCLENWPPLLTQGSPTLGVGVDPALVGTAPMADGTMIVTYNHMPLYYWIEDVKPGETSGQGNNDVWYVVSPAGMVIGREATISVAEDPSLGPILVDGAGMTLYMFTKDEPDKVNCAGKCLENWPPLLTSGNPTLGVGVDPALVGTAPMADGTLIVTYNHMPLYYWIKDTKPGETTGQGNNDVWYVVAPDGNPVGYTAANANDNSNANANDNSNTNSNQNSNDNSENDNGGNGNDNGGG